MNRLIETKQEKYRMEYIRTKMGFESMFEKLYSSCHVGFKKPDPRFFEHILADLQHNSPIQANEIMFWDDEPENVHAANLLGFQGYVYSGFNNFQERVYPLTLR